MSKLVMPETSDQLLQTLLDAFRLGPDQLGNALERFRDELTPALAYQAQQRYRTAVQQHSAAGAMAASTVASRVFNFTGHREEAFNSFVDYLYVLFMLAQTMEEYAHVFNMLQEVLNGDPYGGSGSPLTALRAVLLKADSAFFACEASVVEAIKEFWLQAALETLAAGTPFLADQRSQQLIPGYASTAVAVYRRCVLQRWIGEPWAASGLAALTLALDRDFPRKVIYPGNDAKTENISEARAAMSTLYNRSAYIGDPPTGTPASGLFGRKTR